MNKSYQSDNSISEEISTPETRRAKEGLEIYLAKHPEINKHVL